MSVELPCPPSTAVDATFHAMEEVDEVSRAAGWRGEFRQLGKGPVTSRWRSLHLGQSSVISHRLDNHVHVHTGPPEGCVGLAIMPPPSRMLVEGVEFGGSRAIVTDAILEFVVRGETRCDSLTLPRHEFEASGQALFPGMRTNGETFRLLDAPSSKWSALQREFEHALRDGSVSPEDLSLLLCRFLDLMAGATARRHGEARLGSRSSSHLARLAAEYIEEHYADTIRLEDICLHTGASLRTLQRSFREYYQVSPLAYIKARRLDAARRELVVGTPSSDRVTRIALGNGFTHLGRFSVGYREHFGESPRATLARD